MPSTMTGKSRRIMERPLARKAIASLSDDILPNPVKMPTNTAIAGSVDRQRSCEIRKIGGKLVALLTTNVRGSDQPASFHLAGLFACEV